MQLELGPDEIVLGRVRSHRIFLLRRMLIGFFVIFFLFSNTFLIFRSGWFGAIVFLIALCGLLYYLIQAFVIWDHTMLLITSERVIDVSQRTFFSRQIESLRYGTIAKATVATQKTWVDRFFGCGTILIEGSEGADFDFEFKHAPEPQKVCDLIMDAKTL